jgi:ABC-type uncharacterized transport system involved in gliding motility auxiliary subunit
MTDKINKNIRLSSWLEFVIIATGIILFATVASLLRLRIDLTEDNRYTLSAPTKKVLSV